MKRNTPFLFRSVLLTGSIFLLTGCNRAATVFLQEDTPRDPQSVVATENPTGNIDTAPVRLVQYTPELFSELKGNQKFALYFSASWCPKCRATKKAIAETPEKFNGVTLLDLDYDTETALKKQYGITLQHSLVFFNEDGTIAGTSIMPPDEDVIAFFQKNQLPAPQKDEGSKESVKNNEAPRYVSYSKEMYDELLGKKPMAIFFHAGWCPTCRLQDQLITDNLSSMPKGTTVLKADYDTETELKKKYGITMQSIIVVLDTNGKEVGRIGDFTKIDKLNDLLLQSL